MGNPFPAFYDGIRAAISAAWPQVAGSSHPIYRESQVRRVAWRKLIEQQRLKSPWVVIAVSEAPLMSSYGLANTIYSPRVEIFYITEGVIGEKDMAAYIEGELMALQDVLHPWQQGFQFADGTTIDTSPSNPAMAAFLEENLPLYGGSISFDVRFADGTLPILFDPRFLSKCELALIEVTGGSGGRATATVSTAQTWDILTFVDMIAYEPTSGLSEFGPADGRIRDWRAEQEDFTLTLAVMDGAGRENALTDIWHLRPEGLRFALQASTPEGALGKQLVAWAVPQSLRNGVVYGKNATVMTLKPTFGVLPQWSASPTI